MEEGVKVCGCCASGDHVQWLWWVGELLLLLLLLLSSISVRQRERVTCVATMLLAIMFDGDDGWH